MSGSLTVVDINSAHYQVPAGTTTQMYETVTRVNAEALTTGEVDGDGVFDKLMSSLNAHIKAEYDKGRITGADYTKTYIELTQAALATAMQFLFNRETTFWASQQAQIAAVTGQVQLETQRAGYHTAVYNLQMTLPAQTLLLDKQAVLLDEQIELTDAQAQVAQKQAILVNEQTEVQRAQTMDTRLDGSTAVVGVVGKQKALFTQQVTAYQRDSEVKAARPFVDAWITQKTIDEGLTAPTGFTNASLDDVLSTLKTNNGFV